MARKIVERTAKRMAKVGAELALPKTKDFGDSFGYKSLTLTPNQKIFERMIQENTLVFCHGPAGVGKTAVALYAGVKEYLKDKNKKLIVIRCPAEATDTDKIGALPNSMEEKIAPHFVSAKTILDSLLSKGKVDCDLGNRIQFMIPNFALGMTLSDAFIIFDEGQMASAKTMKLILERIGEGSKMVVLGDSSQNYSDARGRGGLADALKHFFYEDMSAKFDDISYHEFNSDDVVRSAIAKKVVKAYRGEIDVDNAKALEIAERRLQALEDKYA